MIDKIYADKLGLYSNTSAQAESLLYSQEQAVGRFCLYKNEKNRCHLNGKYWKLWGEFLYLTSNILSSKSDVDIGIAKTWNAVDRLSIE